MVELVDQVVCMDVFNVHEAKTHLSRLLDEVQAGREVIIAKRGKPIAKICPIEARTPRKPGMLKGTVSDAFFEPLPESETAGWE